MTTLIPCRKRNPAEVVDLISRWAKIDFSSCTDLILGSQYGSINNDQMIAMLLGLSTTDS